MAEEKTSVRISLRLFAINRSEKRINMKKLEELGEGNEFMGDSFVEF